MGISTAALNIATRWQEWRTRDDLLMTQLRRAVGAKPKLVRALDRHCHELDDLRARLEQVEAELATAREQIAELTRERTR